MSAPTIDAFICICDNIPYIRYAIYLSKLNACDCRSAYVKCIPKKLIWLINDIFCFCLSIKTADCFVIKARGIFLLCIYRFKHPNFLKTDKSTVDVFNKAVYRLISLATTTYLLLCLVLSQMKWHTSNATTCASRYRVRQSKTVM